MAATYYGATAASSVMNPPVCISAAALIRTMDTGSTGGFQGATSAQGARGPAQLWWYTSTATASDVSAANYITDGYYLGMRPADVLLGSYQSSLGSTTGHSYRLWVSGVTTSGVSFTTAQQSTN